MARSVRSRFEKDIQSAIPLIRIDPHSADAMLTRIHQRARRAGDRKASLWSLQLLQMLVGVTGREPKRYVKICRDVAKETPKQPMSYIFLGSAEESNGNVRGAIAAFERALALAAGDRETATLARKSLEQLDAPVPRAKSKTKPKAKAKVVAKTSRARTATPRRPRSRPAARPS